MKRIMGSVLAFALVAGFSLGCREEGPAEKAGRKIDEAVEGVEEKAEELKKEAREATR